MKNLCVATCLLGLLLLGVLNIGFAQANFTVSQDSLIIKVPTEDFIYPLELSLVTVDTSSSIKKLVEGNTSRIDLHLNLIVRKDTQFLTTKRVIKTFSGGKKKTITKQFCKQYSLSLLKKVVPIPEFNPLPNRYPLTIWLSTNSILKKINQN